MIGIYKITNLVNGKHYIGQSIDIHKRWTKEKSNAFNPASNEYECKRSKAFRKYGIDNFIFQVIEECNPEDLNKREIYWIQYYNSYKDGYNETIGGNNAPTISSSISLDTAKQIIDLLIENKLSESEISALFKLSIGTISEINRGHIFKQETLNYPLRTRVNERVKCYCKICGKEINRHATYCTECYALLHRKTERPDKEQLLSEIANSSFAAVGRKYGVTDNAIRKWCIAYNLPTHKKDIIDLYKKQ